jgi:3-polyprenyl-4-hydroxybenzoate decarboxylase
VGGVDCLDDLELYDWLERKTSSAKQVFEHKPIIAVLHSGSWNTRKTLLQPCTDAIKWCGILRAIISLKN